MCCHLRDTQIGLLITTISSGSVLDFQLYFGQGLLWKISVFCKVQGYSSVLFNYYESDLYFNNQIKLYVSVLKKATAVCTRKKCMKSVHITFQCYIHCTYYMMHIFTANWSFKLKIKYLTWCFIMDWYHFKGVKIWKKGSSYFTEDIFWLFVSFALHCYCTVYPVPWLNITCHTIRQS